MKAFFEGVAEKRGPVFRPNSFGASASSVTPTRARVAVYETPGAPPRVVTIDPLPVDEYVEALTSTVHRFVSEQGGSIPYTVLREVTENFIHAGFAEPVVSVMDSGRTVRFADQGPGISDKERAVLPGFTTATAEMKEHIRGVGSGLPLVKDFLGFTGGSLNIEDNLGRGAVVTVSTGRTPSMSSSRTSSHQDYRDLSRTASSPSPSLDGPGLPLDAPEAPVARTIPRNLTTRQKQVLALVMESGSAGPSLVSKELGVGISTAYRDLASLEDMGLITAEGGKRSLTERGLSYLDDLTTGFSGARAQVRPADSTLL